MGKGESAGEGVSITDLSQILDEEHTLLLRFPGKALKDPLSEDVAEEYAIIKYDQAQSGIVVYAKYRGAWKANPWSMRPVVRELLKRAGHIV